MNEAIARTQATVQAQQKPPANSWGKSSKKAPKPVRADPQEIALGGVTRACFRLLSLLGVTDATDAAAAAAMDGFWWLTSGRSVSDRNANPKSYAGRPLISGPPLQHLGAERRRSLPMALWCLCWARTCNSTKS